MNLDATRNPSAWGGSGMVYDAPVPACYMVLPPADAFYTMPPLPAPAPPADPAAPPLLEARQHIMEVCDLAALRTYLATQMAQGIHSCDETFAHTEAFLAQCSPAVDIALVLMLLQGLDAHCDCETYFALRALLVH
jgi:hypothetical protein